MSLSVRVLASFYLLPYHQLVLLTAYPRAAATTKIIREEVKVGERFPFGYKEITY